MTNPLLVATAAAEVAGFGVGWGRMGKRAVSKPETAELVKHIERLCDCLEHAVILARAKGVPVWHTVTRETVVREARAAITKDSQEEETIDD